MQARRSHLPRLQEHAPRSARSAPGRLHGGGRTARIRLLSGVVAVGEFPRMMARERLWSAAQALRGRPSRPRHPRAQARVARCPRSTAGGPVCTCTPRSRSAGFAVSRGVPHQRILRLERPAAEAVQGDKPKRFARASMSRCEFHCGSLLGRYSTPVYAQFRRSVNSFIAPPGACSAATFL
jgi:hypothetical protein